jgi:hypothetical protein
VGPQVTDLGRHPEMTSTLGKHPKLRSHFTTFPLRPFSNGALLVGAFIDAFEER